MEGFALVFQCEPFIHCWLGDAAIPVTHANPLLGSVRTQKVFYARSLILGAMGIPAEAVFPIHQSSTTNRSQKIGHRKNRPQKTNYRKSATVQKDSTQTSED